MTKIEDPKAAEGISEEKKAAEAAGKGERPEKAPKKNWEFTKGVLFGILISAVCVMAVFFVRNGTIGSGAASGEAAGAEALTSRSTLQKLQEVTRKIEDSFLYEADGEQLSEYLFRGVAAGLQDPYASYYSAEELQNVLDISSGAYYGIGITLLQDIQTGIFRVAGVYQDSPAWEAGLRADDQLLEVDGTAIGGMDLSQVVAMIREKQEEVGLTISRNGQELQVQVVPTDVEIPTVSWQMLEGNIGYLRITEFDTVTVQQFREALADLEERGMEALVTDVRDNPGGNLDSVCEILDELLPEGLIVYAENKNGEREEYTSDEEHKFTKPVAVLVNGNSASASEIFAGVLQDYELGPVVGTQTYGKGVVQRTYLLSDGSALKLTTDKYYTAKGQDIDGKGVTPDVIVEENSLGAAETETPEAEQPAETGEAAGEDRTLQKAIELLKAEWMR
ncbi:MAG: S41 family peptidase [Lachnospiraceae bacterium]|nr:S41 family peptidase [Lachnospiraceae bacterium]